MENLKRTLLIVMTLVIVISAGYGSFYFFKNKFTKTDTTEVGDAQQKVSVVSPQLTFNTDNTVPDIIPANLIPSKDIKTVLQSFSTTNTNTGQKNQYTFRYKTDKSVTENKDYFMNTFKKGFSGWYIKNISGDGINFFLIDTSNKRVGVMSITINKNYNDTTVDVTVVK